MANIFEGKYEYEFRDREGFLVTIHADSYEEACKKYRVYCGLE